MKKRTTALSLCVCLLLSLCLPALAAPTRDLQRADVLLQDAGLNALIETALGGAVMADENALAADAAPDDALTASTLMVGLYNLSLPYAEKDLWEGKAHLSAEDALRFAAEIFTTPAAHVPAVSTEDATVAENEIRFDFAKLQKNPMVGAHLYAAQDQDGENLTVQCDLFTYFGESGQSAETVPEDGLTWLCGAEVSLRRAPEKTFGYTVNSFSLSPTYLAGSLAAWLTIENTQYEYSVTLPGIFGLAENAPADMVWQTADDEAQITLMAIDMPAGGYDAVLQQYLKDCGEAAVTESPEFSTFCAVSEGAYELYVVPEGLNWYYVLAMRFPAQRQAEFTLYAEFIRNSLILWGVSNG